MSASANTEKQSAIQAVLEEVVASAPFRSSRRYPAMLRYIVEKTLAGEQESLKERTIGVEVFGRKPDYDTNADPVVRFSAGEVRKRLAQFYRDSEKDYPVELELPLGTYVPRFHHRALIESPGAEIDIFNTDHDFRMEPIPAPHARQIQRGKFVSVAAFLVLALLVGLAVHERVRQPSPVAALWAPLLNNPDPVLISVGQPHKTPETPEPADPSIKDHILQPEFRVSITTVSAVANMVGFLQAQHKAFRIKESYSDTLADLHGRPVVLVNANNNQWTLLLLQALRFHFESNGDFSYIEDSQNPGYRGWSVDFTKPYLSQTTDYAIVARFKSATTDGPVMVVAGISSNGTEAAGEFVVSPEFLTALMKRAPRKWNRNGNFEAVLKVEVVGGNTGAISVVASQFW